MNQSVYIHNPAMRRIIHLRFLFFPLLLLLGHMSTPDATSQAGAPAESGNIIVYAYFLEDPTSTIRISWISESAETGEFQYLKDGSGEWEEHRITRITDIPGSQRTLFEVHMRNLEPGSSYEFRIGANSNPMRFRTLPAKLEQPVHFVTGGDLFLSDELMSSTTRAASTRDPYFAAIGGDWAYADGDPGRVDRWFRLFEIWQQHMVTPGGYLVPFIPAIGNHEVQGGYLQTPDKAPLYFTFFDKPDKRTYFSVDIGEYMSIIVLDSQHLARIDGPQKQWLAEALSARQHFPHVFPVYHVPAWPSFRSLTNTYSSLVRLHWVPLFEENGIALSFENHDHTFKRTKPLRNNKVDPEGVVYIGDGAWGVTTRRDDDAHNRWYLEKVTDDNHFWEIILYPESRVVQAFDTKGGLLDFFEQTINEPRARDVFGIADPSEDLPYRIILSQNYPNPFNPSTTISFYLPEDSGSSHVRLDVFDLYGRRVSTLLNAPLRAGAHTITFDIHDAGVSSGTYVYRLQYRGETRSRKMQIVK
jgi:acid phosphatase type 7